MNSGDISGVLTVLIVFYFIALSIRTIFEYKLKNRLIEKGAIKEEIRFLSDLRWSANGFSSLKWGLVLLGIGVALLVAQTAPDWMREEVTVGAVFFMAGVGLLVHYGLAKRLEKTPKK